MMNRNIHGVQPGDNGETPVHDHSGMQQQIDPNAGFAKGGLVSPNEKKISDREAQDFWMRYRKQKGYQTPLPPDDGTFAPLDYSTDNPSPELAKFAKGGIMTRQADGDPIEVPPGALPSEVKDDITAKLSPGEFTLPADVVRYIGLQKLVQIRDSAKKGLMAMQDEGQIQQAPTDGNSMPAPVSGDVSTANPGFATGGLMSDPNAQGPQLVQYVDPTTGRMGYHYVDAAGKPIVGETVAAPQQNIPNVTIPVNANLTTGQAKTNGSGNGQGNGGGTGTGQGNPGGTGGGLGSAYTPGNGNKFRQAAGLPPAGTNGLGAPVSSPEDIGSQMPSANGASVGKYQADHSGGGSGIGTNTGDKATQANDFANSNVAATPSPGVAMNMAGIVAGLGSPISTAVGLGVRALTGNLDGASFNTPGPTLSTDAQQRVRSAYMTGGLSLATSQLEKERQLATNNMKGDTASIDNDTGARNALAAEGNISREGFSTSRTGREALPGAAQDGPSSNDGGGDHDSGAAADHGGGGIGSGRGQGGGGQGDNAGFAKGGLMMPKKKVPLKLAKGGLAVPQDYDTVSTDDKLQPENDVVSRYDNFLKASKALGLTKQEQNLYQHHLKNMEGGGSVKNPDGGTSTIFQVDTEGPDGRIYNVPTVWHGKILPPREGVKEAAKVGWDHWPSYTSSDEAEARYNQMHGYMEQDIPHQGWDAINGEGQ